MHERSITAITNSDIHDDCQSLARSVRGDIIKETKNSVRQKTRRMSHRRVNPRVLRKGRFKFIRAAEEFVFHRNELRANPVDLVSATDCCFSRCTTDVKLSLRDAIERKHREQSEICSRTFNRPLISPRFRSKIPVLNPLSPDFDSRNHALSA